MKWRALKRGVVGVLGPLGVYPLARRLTRGSPRVLMYHRFSEHPHPRKLSADSFRWQLSELAKRFEVVTLAEMNQRWQTDGKPPEGCAVITVDDGYRDFVDIALPILKEFGLPATLFVSTRFADGDFWLWPDKLEYALFKTEASSLSLGDRHWALTDDSQRWRCFGDLCNWFTRIPHDEKEQWIGRMLDTLLVTPPAAPTEAFAPASWSDLRRVSGAGIEIGGHTKTHPVLSRISIKQLDDEIGGCKRIIEAKIEAPISSFCYPNGQPEDISEEVRLSVARNGFACAVAAYFRFDVLSDRYEIKRYSAGEDPTQFNKNLDGVEYYSSVLHQRLGI